MSTKALVILMMCEVAAFCQYCPEPSYFMQDTERMWCSWLTPRRDTLHNTTDWCAESGDGLLLTIEDSNVQAYFELNVAPSLRLKNISKVWINYNLATETTFEDIKLTFRNTEISSSSECVTINTDDGHWEPTRCSEEVHGVCYKVIECPAGSYLDTINRLCLWLTNDMEDAVRGQRQCLSEHGTLGVVPMSESQLPLPSALRQRNLLTSIPYNEMWIGVTDTCYEGEFYDWQGETLPSFIYGPLQQSAVRSTDPNEDCVVINVEREHIELFVRDCNETRISLCSRNVDALDTDTIPTSPEIICPKKLKYPTPPLLQPALKTPTEPPTISSLPQLMTSASTTNVPPPTTHSKEGCHWQKYETKLNSTAAMDKRLKKLRTNTFIDKKKTTAHKRRLVSADDPRPSSRNIGVAATIVMASVFAFIILPDVVNVVLAVWKTVRSGTTHGNRVISA